MVCIVSSCGKAEAPRASATEVTEIALSDVPQTVNDLVQATRPDFTTTEVLKKVREGRVYYDVEGELTDGDELSLRRWSLMKLIQKTLKLFASSKAFKQIIQLYMKFSLQIIPLIRDLK